jgi:diguanylate cyclase (GGDEF)-like protein
LKAVAEAIKESLSRADDFVARYGGEEFAVVLPGTDETGARIIADRMLNAIRELKIPHEDYDEGFVTVSIGITSGSPTHKQSWNEYMEKADEALYISKHEGRNRCTFLALQEA